jgi:hypothetical protein
MRHMGILTFENSFVVLEICDVALSHTVLICRHRRKVSRWRTEISPGAPSVARLPSDGNILLICTALFGRSLAQEQL